MRNIWRNIMHDIYRDASLELSRQIKIIDGTKFRFARTAHPHCAKKMCSAHYIEMEVRRNNYAAMQWIIGIIDTLYLLIRCVMLSTSRAKRSEAFCECTYVSNALRTVCIKCTSIRNSFDHCNACLPALCNVTVTKTIHKLKKVQKFSRFFSQ